MEVISPGVRRLGSDKVNWYLVEDAGKLTVVDAGVPGYWDQVEPALQGLGVGFDDVAAVLLTHAHSDHTGIAGKLHERGIPVYLHRDDQELLRTGKEPWKREANPLPYLRRPGIWSLFWHFGRNGALTPPKIGDALGIEDGDLLDVPGRPRVIHTPGHTPGSCSFWFEESKAVFTGDLMCTWNPFTGRRGPQIMPRPTNVSSAQSTQSLARIETLDSDVVLPGHGEPWTDGVRSAVERARAAGES